MGRGLSDLQRRILAAALEGRADAVKQMPSAGIGRFDAVLRVPLPDDVVRRYRDALARYRRWQKYPERMRRDIAEEDEVFTSGRHEESFAYPDDVVIVMRCGLQEAVDGIGSECHKIRCSLFDAMPDENTREGTVDVHDSAPACVFLYPFDTKAEADAFRDRNAGAITNLTGRPGATVDVHERAFAAYPDLLVRAAVLLAGEGERTASAEAVASRAIARLERRGLAVTGRATEWRIWSPRALWLTASGLAVARGIAPAIADRIDDLLRAHAEAQAAEEARRRAERSIVTPEEEAEANNAMNALQSMLAAFGGMSYPQEARA